MACLQANDLPRHVAIVMDGNGRWAKERHQPRLAGHRQGTMHARDFIEVFAEYNIPYLSLYAFSTENWNRPRAEVEGIMMIINEAIDEAADFAVKKNIRVNHLGSLDKLAPGIQSKVHKTMALTSRNSGLTVNVAFNYGGRAEIVNALRKIIDQNIPADQVDEELVSRNLYTGGMPDPDLFIRTGNELRMSNFLIWQAAYAELYFTPALWPDFDRAELEKALVAYSKRQRRFGNV